MMQFIIRKRNGLLIRLARAIVKKYEPGIIAITGAVGKTSTEEAICAVLREIRSVRGTSPYFANALQIPLAIIGPWTEGSGMFFWLKVIAAGIQNLLITKEYPELLILEYTTRSALEMRELLAIARPQITVATTLYDAPYNETIKLIEALPSNGYSIVQCDDPATARLRERTRAHSMTFGFNEGADMRITNLEYHAEELSDGVYKPVGITCNLAYGEQCVPVRLDGAFGKAPAYAIAAAASVGMAFGLNLVRIAEALHYYRIPPGRMHLIPGKKGTYIFDDTRNATLASLKEAIETIAALPAKRVISVLGAMDIREKDARDSYDALIYRAAKISDICIIIGNAHAIDKRNSMRFDTAEQASAELQTLIERGDVILVKGLHTHSIVQALSSHRLVA